MPPGKLDNIPHRNNLTPLRWHDAAESRPDVAASILKQVGITFDDKYVQEDETQSVGFHYLGHAHTLGDSVEYSSRHKLLCAGDACVKSAFNKMGHWQVTARPILPLELYLPCLKDLILSVWASEARVISVTPRGSAVCVDEVAAIHINPLKCM